MLNLIHYHHALHSGSQKHTPGDVKAPCSADRASKQGLQEEVSGKHQVDHTHLILHLIPG